ncbi:uncharacterized protein LOC120637300 isoform X1 [Pararge aegeria]|uniref:uncharacterized protein LOC120637300 isoform X1 n=1 Tax=Pararge aegeria TaxID=116150 RepID=UPI0019CF82CB|nr:uncharacterized protein LOC120637300 isoform X1 [Pararge aegeria]
MEHNINEESSDKKLLNKAKSQCIGQSKKVACEPAKHKSFNSNEAVRSLDVALARLKKSKLVNGECITNTSQAKPAILQVIYFLAFPILLQEIISWRNIFGVQKYGVENVKMAGQAFLKTICMINNKKFE